MAKKNYQQSLSLDALYEVERREANEAERKQLNPSVWFNSGSVDVYTSQSATTPTALSEMTLNTAETGVSGLKTSSTESNAIPRYIAIVQNTGTTTEIIASGFSDAINHGAIS